MRKKIVALAKGAVWVLFGVMVFVVAAVFGVGLHLHLRVAREAALVETRAALKNAFAGELRIERVGDLGFDGVHDARATMLDPDGVQVIHVDHVTASLSVFHAARAALVGDKIVIDSVHIGDANVSLDQRGEDLRIARAFASRTPSPPSSSPSTFKLSIDHIALDHAWIHGILSGQTIDADVHDARASLGVDPEGVAVVLDRASIEARAMPRDANPRGDVHGELVDRDVIQILGGFDGDIGGIAASATAMLVDDWFSARAKIPNASLQQIRTLVPEACASCDVTEHASLTAIAEGKMTSFGVTATTRVGEANVVARALYDHGAMKARAIADHVDAHTFATSLGHTNARADVAATMKDDSTWVVGDLDPQGAHAEVVAAMTKDAINGRLFASIASANTLLAPFGVAANGSGDIHGSAHFGRNDKRVSADLLAERIAVPRLAVRSAYVTMRGTEENAALTARVSARGPFDVHARGGLRKNNLDVDALDVEADGKSIAHGSLEWEGSTAHAKLDAHDVDLDQVKRTLGLDLPVSGSVGAIVDARIARDRVQGRVELDARHLDAGSIHDLNVHAEVASLGDTWSIVSRLRLGNIGWGSIEAMDLVPSGAPFDVESWKHARGSVHIDAGGNLGRALSGVDGDARVAILIHRPAIANPPDLTVDASVHRLLAQSIDGLDVAMHAHLDPQGHLATHTDASRGGAHLLADASTNVAWADVMRGKLPNFEALPFVIDAAVPTHDASALCRAFDTTCRGALDVALHVDGNAADPHVKANFTFGAFRSRMSPFGAPIDGTVTATFDRRLGNAKLSIRSATNWNQSIDGDVALDATSLRDWFVTGKINAHDMPIRTPPDLADTNASADLSGTIALDNFHRDTRLHVVLDATHIQVEEAKSDTAKVTLDFDGHTLSFATNVQAANSSLDLHGKTTISWGSAIKPTIDKNTTATIGLRAKNFRACNVAPLVPADIGQVDGLINADADADIVLATSKVTMHGFVAIDEGTFLSTSVGALQDIRGRIVMQKDGTLVLENGQVRGTSGLARITAKAIAPGGTIQRVDIAADIGKNDPFPVVVAGSRLGTAFGHVEVTAHPHDGTLDVAVRVPSLHVVLPDTGFRDLEALDAPRNITIGIRNPQGVLVPITLGSPKKETKSAPWTITVDLGNDVRVERGDMLAVMVTGHPKIEIGDTTRVTGQVFITRGTLDVQGKRFEIDHGEATFTGDPSNPTLFVSATWDAPDGSRVFADYTGPVQNGKLSLRSEPTHTRDEIISLLVFGSSDGPAIGQPGGNAVDTATTQALGTGVSLATQPMNKALSQLTHLDLKTRVDTGSASGARSEVELQIAREISVQVAYVLGLPPPGTDPDRTWLTVMFHLTARWTLNFTMGDHGSSIVDMLWHYRY